MIDIRFVIAHSLWILGAAVALASFSYHKWLARERHMPLRQMLRLAGGWKLSINGSILLVASGFLLMESAYVWEKALWLVVWAGAAFDLSRAT